MKQGHVLTALVLTAITLSACQVLAPPPRSGLPPTNPVATAELPPTAAARGPNTLIIGLTEEPDVLNPYISFMWVTQSILNSVMSSLLSFDKDLNLQPALAESYTISPDNLIYTFKLRKDVKWHDGHAFSAQDVVATWKVIMDPKFAAIDQSGWNKISSIETPDDYTVIMKTSETYAPFLAFVAGTWRISPKHLIDKGVDSFKQEFGRHPIGTGPFKFAKWESRQFMLLERNPDYFGGSPKLDNIRIKFVPDTNTLLLQLQTGEVQMTDNLGATEYESIKQLTDSRIELTSGNTWTHIDLKNIDFLMDKRVRQALDYATPRQEIADQLFKGLAIVASGDQSPATQYSNPNITPRPLDLNKAASLLKEAGFTKNANGVLEKDGKPLRIEYFVGTGYRPAKLAQQVIAASWRKLGVDVVESEQDPSIWVTADGMYYKKAMTASHYDFTNLIDPDNLFYWHSQYTPKEPGGIGGNYPAVFNPYEKQAQFDELTTSAAREMVTEKRKQLYWQIEDLIHEEVPAILLYWSKHIYVAPKNLTGFEPNGVLPLMANSETWAWSN